MKQVLILLAVGIAGVAAADPRNPCGKTPGASVTRYQDAASGAAAFQCAPAPIGTGTAPTFRSNTAGTIAWWYCPSANGTYHANWAAATAARLSASTFFDEAYAVMTSPNPKAAFDAITAKNVTLPLSDPSLTPVWCPYFDEMIRSTPAAANRGAGVSPRTGPPAPK